MNNVVDPELKTYPEFGSWSALAKGTCDVEDVFYSYSHGMISTFDGERRPFTLVKASNMPDVFLAGHMAPASDDSSAIAVFYWEKTLELGDAVGLVKALQALRNMYEDNGKQALRAEFKNLMQL